MAVIYVVTDDEVKEMLNKIAKEDMRSGNAEVVWLIRQEWLRRYGKAAPDAFNKEEDDGADAKR